jgi:hypothetical protein
LVYCKKIKVYIWLAMDRTGKFRCFTPILPRGFSMTIPESYYIMVDHL